MAKAATKTSRVKKVAKDFPNKNRPTRTTTVKPATSKGQLATTGGGSGGGGRVTPRGGGGGGGGGGGSNLPAKTGGGGARKPKTNWRVGRNTALKALGPLAALIELGEGQSKEVYKRLERTPGGLKKLKESADKEMGRVGSKSTFPARPETHGSNEAKSSNGKAAPAEVKKEAKKTVKAAKKAVKTATKTVKKAASLKSGTPLGMKNTYTTSGTHAGGRKSSASRKIKRAKSLGSADYAR